MTLDGAALILVASFAEKIFPQPIYRWMAGVAIAVFFLSLLGGGMAYLSLLSSHPRTGSLPASKADQRVTLVSTVLTFSCFMIGIGLGRVNTK